MYELVQTDLNHSHQNFWIWIFDDSIWSIKNLNDSNYSNKLFYSNLLYKFKFKYQYEYEYEYEYKFKFKFIIILKFTIKN